MISVRSLVYPFVAIAALAGEMLLHAICDTFFGALSSLAYICPQTVDYDNPAVAMTKYNISHVLLG